MLVVIAINKDLRFRIVEDNNEIRYAEMNVGTLTKPHWMSVTKRLNRFDMNCWMRECMGTWEKHIEVLS